MKNNQLSCFYSVLNTPTLTNIVRRIEVNLMCILTRVELVPIFPSVIPLVSSYQFSLHYLWSDPLFEYSPFNFCMTSLSLPPPSFASLESPATVPDTFTYVMIRIHSYYIARRTRWCHCSSASALFSRSLPTYDLKSMWTPIHYSKTPIWFGSHPTTVCIGALFQHLL